MCIRDRVWGTMPKSARMNSRKSRMSRRGLKTKELKTRPGSKEARAERSRVVLPVPTAPVRTMNPLCALMPYSRVARASRVCGIRTRKRGSGLSAKGVLWRWKKLLYMVIRGIRERGNLGGFASEELLQAGELAGLAVCHFARPCDDGQSGQFGEGPDVTLAAQCGVAVFKQSAEEQAEEEAGGKTSGGEDPALGIGGTIGEIGFVQQTECLSFLAVLEVGGHLGLVELGQITIVQGLRGLGVTGQLLELRLDLRAGLDAPLVGMDLLVELSLFGTLGLDTDVGGADAGTQVLDGRGVVAACGGAGSRGRWGGGRLRHLAPQVGDLAVDLDQSGVVGGVVQGESGLLGLHVLQLLLVGLRGDCAGRGRGLLGEHRIHVGLVLLHTAEGLGGCVELCVEGAEDVDVVGLIFWQHSKVLSLEGGELCVLVVEGALGAVELLLEEVGCALGGLRAGAEIGPGEEGGDLGANLLRGVGVAGGEEDFEAGESIGAGDLACDGLDVDALARQRDAVVQGEMLIVVEAELFNDGLKAGAAEDLLLHGCQAAVDVFGDDGGDKVLRDFLLVDEDEGLGDVLRRDVQGGDD